MSEVRTSLRRYCLLVSIFFTFSSFTSFWWSGGRNGPRIKKSPSDPYVLWCFVLWNLGVFCAFCSSWLGFLHIASPGEFADLCLSRILGVTWVLGETSVGVFMASYRKHISFYIPSLVNHLQKRPSMFLCRTASTGAIPNAARKFSAAPPWSPCGHHVKHCSSKQNSCEPLTWYVCKRHGILTFNLSRVLCITLK